MRCIILFRNKTTLAIAGLALSFGLIATPANASKQSDAATRYAASIYAQQHGLPANYYDVQQSMQKASRNNNNNLPSYTYGPYGGYYPPNNTYNNPYYNSGYNPYYGYNTPYYGSDINTYNPYYDYGYGYGYGYNQNYNPYPAYNPYNTPYYGNYSSGGVLNRVLNRLF